MSAGPDQPTGGKKARATIPIRAKMAAALLVPLVAVAALSLVQVNQARDRVKTTEAETQLAKVALAPGGLVDALIVEQGDATVTFLGLRDTATIPTEDWAASKAATDAALADFRQGVADGGPVAQELFRETLDELEGQLADQRTKLDAMTERGLANIVPILDEVYPAYSEIVSNLLASNRELADAITDPTMRGAAETINATNQIHFDVSRLMSAVGTGILRPGNEGRDPVVTMANDYEQAISDLRSRTDGPWGEAVQAFADNPRYQQIIDWTKDYLETGEIVLNDYIALNPPVLSREDVPLGTSQYVVIDANEKLSQLIDDQLADARAESRRYTITGILVTVAAAAAALFVAGSIVRPMRKLTQQAEQMASETLPKAVQGILDTPAHEDVVIPELAPVNVKSRDELQTVAGAINHVQSSALDLAVEQATLRRNIADSFVSLGRRTQNLISLQLELITNLERDEADPAVLESLYRLDHLATRARRNAESLVVLGGTASQQTGGRPVAMTDVVRAMLSEVEAYQRVDITHVDDAFVPGSAAADSIHLLAELVENGLSFSPPTSRVEVTGRRNSKGYTIQVTDHGVGMTAERLAQANRRLADNESFTVAPSRYLGHYVTGKLAARVGATVSLESGTNGGVVATVFIPSNALVSDVEAQRSGRSSAPADEPQAAPPADGPTDSAVKVDGRPPAVAAGTNRAVGDQSSANGGSQEPSEPDVGAAADVDSDVPVETTAGGLRKRVPGVHAQAVRDRSPLLRSAAARGAEDAPLGAETTPQAAENLASLLGDYTSGLERGRDDLAGATTQPEQSE